MTGFSGDECLSFSKARGINYEPRKRGGKRRKPFTFCSIMVSRTRYKVHNNNVMALCAYFKCPRRKIPALLLLKVTQILVITR